MEDLENLKIRTINPPQWLKHGIKSIEQYYQEEMKRQLLDLDTYTLLYGNPIACRKPIIYFLPKIHKDPVRPQGRPIINGIESICSRLGQCINYFLQPLVTQMGGLYQRYQTCYPIFGVSG